MMDIGSKRGFPAGTLSNFSPHPFVIDGVECASMEGFLQSLKFKNPGIQRAVCKLVGFKAKSRGSGKNWQTKQELYWQDEVYPRDSQEYQDLLDRAYLSMFENKKFRNALRATGNTTLTHAIGKKNKSETVLTRTEFCGRLMWLRDKLENEVK